MFKLNRADEVVLIQAGLKSLLQNAFDGKRTYNKTKKTVNGIKKANKKKRTMSVAARKKISRRMRKMWADKRKGQ